MATLNIPLDAFYGVLLIFLRVAAIVFNTPIFDTPTIPIVFKAGLAFAVSILLLPVVDTVVYVADLSLVACPSNCFSPAFNWQGRLSGFKWAWPWPM